MLVHRSPLRPTAVVSLPAGEEPPQGGLGMEEKVDKRTPLAIT